MRLYGAPKADPNEENVKTSNQLVTRNVVGNEKGGGGGVYEKGS